MASFFVRLIAGILVIVILMVTSPLYTGVELFSFAWFAFTGLFVVPILFSNKLQEIMSTETVRVDPIKKWFPKALNELKQIHDYNWGAHRIIPEAYISVPFGAIWVVNKSNLDIVVAFVDIRSGAKNIVVSNLEYLQWHLRNKKVESVQDVAKIYLKIDKKLSIKALDVQKNVEVIVQ